LMPDTAAHIAQRLLEAFDDYRAAFRDLTEGARARFELAQWTEIQDASTARINLYDERIYATKDTLSADPLCRDILDADCWPAIKQAYIALIEDRFDDDLAETWFNSVFFKMHRHDQISDRTMFVHTTRPPVRKPSRVPLTRGFISGGCLTSLARQILDQYTFDVPWA